MSAAGQRAGAVPKPSRTPKTVRTTCRHPAITALQHRRYRKRVDHVHQCCLFRQQCMQGAAPTQHDTTQHKVTFTFLQSMHTLPSSHGPAQHAMVR